MLNSAANGEIPAMLFADLDPTACCVFCGRPRPLEVLATWMCHRCKQKPIFALLQLLWRRRQESAA